VEIATRAGVADRPVARRGILDRRRRDRVLPGLTRVQHAIVVGVADIVAAGHDLGRRDVIRVGRGADIVPDNDIGDRRGAGVGHVEGIHLLATGVDDHRARNFVDRNPGLLHQARVDRVVGLARGQCHRRGQAGGLIDIRVDRPIGANTGQGEVVTGRGDELDVVLPGRQTGEVINPRRIRRRDREDRGGRGVQKIDRDARDTGFARIL
jgi:hypothetical protein